MQPLGSSQDDIRRMLDTLRTGGRHARVGILFSGPGCRACRVVKSGLDAARLGAGSVVYEADVITNADLADAYGVASTPTMIVLDGTSVRGRCTGVDPSVFNDLLSQHARA